MDVNTNIVIPSLKSMCLSCTLCLRAAQFEDENLHLHDSSALLLLKICFAARRVLGLL